MFTVTVASKSKQKQKNKTKTTRKRNNGSVDYYLKFNSIWLKIVDQWYNTNAVTQGLLKVKFLGPSYSEKSF